MSEAGTQHVSSNAKTVCWMKAGVYLKRVSILLRRFSFLKILALWPWFPYFQPIIKEKAIKKMKEKVIDLSEYQTQCTFFIFWLIKDHTFYSEIVMHICKSMRNSTTSFYILKRYSPSTRNMFVSILNFPSPFKILTQPIFFLILCFYC